MIYRNKIFRLTGYLPSYLNDFTNTMSNHKGITRFLIHLFLLFLYIVNVILFLVVVFWESKADNIILQKKVSTDGLLIPDEDEATTPSKEVEITPTPTPLD